MRGSVHGGALSAESRGAAVRCRDDTEGDLAERRRTGSVARAGAPRYDASLLTPDDLHLFNEGTHLRLYERLGSHPRVVDGVAGTSFAVFAPNAASRLGHRATSTAGTQGEPSARSAIAESGIWEAFVPGVGRGAVYKYHILPRLAGYRVDKADPFAVRQEAPPRTGSVVWDLEYRWRDDRMDGGARHRTVASAPISIYEVHLGSWRRVPEEGNRR